MFRIMLILVFFFLFAATAPFVAAQVNGPGTSNPNDFDVVINLPADQPAIDGSIGNRDGATTPTTQLNVSEGGGVGISFNAHSGSEVNVNGGTADAFFNANAGSEINISRGSVAESFNANSGSLVNLSGGTVSALFNAFSGSEVNISGGNVGFFFSAFAGSHVELIGGEFQLDGVAYNNPTITLAPDEVFTGTLADGSSFIFSQSADDTLSEVKLTQAAVPTLDVTPQLVNTDISTTAPSGLRAGQTLTLQTEGVLGNNFAVVDATLNVEDGIVGTGLEVARSVVNINGGFVGLLFDANSGSEVNIRGGYVGDFFQAFSGSMVNVSGGVVASSFEAHSGSVVTISGGSVGDFLRADGGSVVNISGGKVGDSILVDPGSEVTITGGTIGKGFNAFANGEVTMSGGSVGNGFRAFSGNGVELIGGEFLLNGAAYTDPTITISSGDVFTGTLTDGSTFVFSPDASDRLFGVTLTPVSLPPPNTAPQMVNTDISASAPSGLRAGQTLTLQTEGELSNNFAVVDATLNIEGGSVGDEMEIARGVVNLREGTVGDDVDAHSGSEVNIFGGVVGDEFEAFSGSVVNIHGGIVGASFVADTESVVNISGGSLGDDFRASAGSIVNISGGSLGDSFRASVGSEVNIRGGSFGNGFRASSANGVELLGGEFLLNGVAYTDPTITIRIRFDDVFTGTLADGSTFVFSPGAFDSLFGVTLTPVSLPPPNTALQMVNTDISASAPSGLRAGQSMAVQNGGVLGDNFAVVDATLDIEGGSVGDELEISRGVVNLREGTVGDDVDAHSGSEVNIFGGVVGDEFEAFSGSVVTISGGSVGDFLRAYEGSVVNISGGKVGDSISVAPGSKVNISGGSLGDDFRASFGSEVNIRGGSFGDRFTSRYDSEVNLFGTEFFLDGLPLDSLEQNEAFVIAQREGAILSGTFADGSLFSFVLDDSDGGEDFFEAGAVLTVTLVPEPMSVLLLSFAVVAYSWRWPTRVLTDDDRTCCERLL